MSVWGIGAYYPREQIDKSSEFIKNAQIYIGYSEKEHPDYYMMLRSIALGDIIFIKARYMLNKPMKIKAIGIATRTYGLGDKDGISVVWIKDFTKHPIDIEKDRFNDGSTRTIYQERNPIVINQIAELLKKS
nr:hypothetical protein [uncultured Merdimonas sp.]